MPLTPGSSRDVVSGNIREMMKAGKRPQRQAVAAALNSARKGKRKGKRSMRKGGRS